MYVYSPLASLLRAAITHTRKKNTIPSHYMMNYITQFHLIGRAV